MSSKKVVNNDKRKDKASSDASPSSTPQIGDFCNYEGLAVNAILFLIFFNILIRFSVGLEGYSGYKKPPMHGDYEAQRHWMEITTNLKPEQWYVQSEDNDLLYWGLDYPPLTAYHHYVLGLISRYFEPASVQLHTSRGYETPSHKLFMRTSVVVTDVLIYFTAVYLFVYHSYFKNELLRRKFEIFAFILIQPALILIDHGHFQFNSICLGFTVLAIHNILCDRELIGSFFFVLALNYKQMSLYYAPVFFFYLFGKSIAQARNTNTWWMAKVLAIGIVVLASFALCWQPFLRDKDIALQVLSRMFPVGRGLFEDKVANFWCTISPFVKLKTMFSPDLLLKLCTLATLAAMTPSCIIAFLRLDGRNFLSSLFNTSMAFFLFSYQAHEKSILLPLLPITLLNADYGYLSVWVITTASFSMVPLLFKDGLLLAYIVLQIGSILFYLKYSVIRNSVLFYLHLLAMTAIHIVHATVTPPERYPDIITLAITSYSFMIFFLSFLLVNFRQWQSYFGKQRRASTAPDSQLKEHKTPVKEKKVKTVKRE